MHPQLLQSAPSSSANSKLVCCSWLLPVRKYYPSFKTRQAKQTPLQHKWKIMRFSCSTFCLCLSALGRGKKQVCPVYTLSTDSQRSAQRTTTGISVYVTLLFFPCRSTQPHLEQAQLHLFTSLRELLRSHKFNLLPSRVRVLPLTFTETASGVGRRMI